MSLAFSSTAVTLTDQPENITEAEDLDSTTTTYTTPQDKSGVLENEPSLAPEDRSSTLYRLSGNDTITYVADVFDAVTNGTEEIEIIIGKSFCTWNDAFWIVSACGSHYCYVSSASLPS